MRFNYKKIDWLAVLGFIILLAVVWFFGVIKAHASIPSDFGVMRKFYPTPPAMAYKFGIYHNGPFEVAKVFGRIANCSDADEDFIRIVSTTALRHNLDPRLLAATVAVESNCNTNAVSPKGALGLMGIMVPVWKTKFDFSNYNLLNEKDNLEIGAQILSDSIKKYGLNEGIHHYNGMGVGCQYCDSGYTSKILTLAGRSNV